MRRLMETLYIRARSIPAAVLPTLLSDNIALKAWRHLISRGSIPSGSLRFAFWVRSAPAMHQATSLVFHCPLCSAPCTSWGEHLTTACPLSAAAALRGMRALALFLYRKRWDIRWLTSACFHTTGPPGSPQRWVLLRDGDLLTAGPTTWDAAMTWSGLLWVRPPCRVAVQLRSDLTGAFLTAIDAWLNAAPSWRWECLTSPTNPNLDPEAVVGPVPILSTLLTHLLRLPASQCTGPAAPLIAHLQSPQQTSPNVLLSCGSLQPPFGPTGPCAISILQPPPLAIPPGMQLLHLPADLSIIFPNGHLCATVRRTLDVFFPPHPEHQQPNLWTTSSDTDHTPSPPPEDCGSDDDDALAVHTDSSSSSASDSEDCTDPPP